MSKSGRTQAGTFAPGTPGGPGRPKKSGEAAYLAILRQVLTPARWRSIIERAVKDAEAGHPEARDWLTRTIATPAILRAFAEVSPDSGLNANEALLADLNAGHFPGIDPLQGRPLPGHG